MLDRVVAELRESARLKEWVATNLAEGIVRAAQAIVEAYRKGGKVFFCGNGGSAADSQHLAAEFVGRFGSERPALAALALTTDTSIITAVSNDWGFERVFSRQLEALASSKDVLIAISTSGKSQNVNAAVETAKKLGVKTIGLSGGDGGALAGLVHIPLVISSQSVPRIQECHITIGHIICDLVEKEIFGK